MRAASPGVMRRASVACDVRRNAARCSAGKGDSPISSIFERAMDVARSRNQGRGAHRSADGRDPADRGGSRPIPQRLKAGVRRAEKKPSKSASNVAEVAKARLMSEGGGLSMARRRMCAVTFMLRFGTEIGENVRIVGSHARLGGWDVASAPALRWAGDDTWEVTIDLPCGSIYEYKYVVCSESGAVLRWQTGNNALLAVRAQEPDALTVRDAWGGVGSSIARSDGEETSREAALNAWVADVEGMLEEGMVQVRELKLELAAAKQELVATRQEALELRHESEQAKAMAVQANDKYMLSLKEKEKALRQKELLLRQIQLERFERGGSGE